MSARPHFSSLSIRESDFTFSGRQRVFVSVEALPFRWPTKPEVANDYIASWRGMADDVLGGLKLSKKTMHAIASHISRRDGSCRLSDKALTARSGRSLRSTKRDIQRMKTLGLLIAEYDDGEDRTISVRVLKMAVPSPQRKGQRIPPAQPPEEGPTYPPYVGPLD